MEIRKRVGVKDLSDKIVDMASKTNALEFSASSTLSRLRSHIVLQQKHHMGIKII